MIITYEYLIDPIKVTLIENRTAGGACNPYLATAVTIAAGIDGIKNKIDPPKMYDRGTFDQNTLINSIRTAVLYYFMFLCLHLASVCV